MKDIPMFLEEHIENCSNNDIELFMLACSDAMKEQRFRQFFDTFLRAIRRRKTIVEAIKLAKGIK